MSKLASHNNIVDYCTLYMNMSLTMHHRNFIKAFTLKGWSQNWVKTFYLYNL